MSHGDPSEPIPVFGKVSVPRWKLCAYIIFGYVGAYTAFKLYSSTKSRPAPSFDSPEQKAWVEKYIARAKIEEKKPEPLRIPFDGPSGLYPSK